MRSHWGWLLAAVCVEAAIAVLHVLVGGGALAVFLVAGPLLAAYRLTATRTAAVAGLAVLLAVVLPAHAGDAVGPTRADYLNDVLAVASGGLSATLVASARTRSRRAEDRTRHGYARMRRTHARTRRAYARTREAYATTRHTLLRTRRLLAHVQRVHARTRDARDEARRAHRETHRALLRMTRIAQLSQQAIVRPLPPAIGDVELAVRTRSATEHALIGGDLHDAILTPTGPRLIVGDAKGHGLDAVRLSAAVLAAFRQTAAAEPDLARLARTLDTRIAGELGAEDFVTLVLADFAPGEVRLVNCGHPPPLRAGRDLEVLEPAAPSPPLGLTPEPALQRVVLAPGQRLLLYTDGLAEARDAKGALFPLDYQVRDALGGPTLDASLGRLLDLLYAHAGTATADDLTLILAEPAPSPAPSPVPHPGAEPPTNHTAPVRPPPASGPPPAPEPQPAPIASAAPVAPAPSYTARAKPERCPQE
ncbi:PP2C family protein-serine/threonine phosphatase [Streptomyces sp. NPDC057702]|uniref:PP2C family protein-serine/threonine phosphatase n=1 Tax=unclassified Streptomyces TaxID=2593676 RepID=UPI003675D91D